MRTAACDHSPRDRRRPRRLAAFGVLAAAALSAAAGCGAPEEVTELLDPRQDPRFIACLGEAGDALTGFAVRKTDRWSDHFAVNPPFDGEIGRDAFLVIFPLGWPGVVFGGGMPRPDPGHADVCLWYGTIERARECVTELTPCRAFELYANVDITGLRP